MLCAWARFWDHGEYNTFNHALDRWDTVVRIPSTKEILPNVALEFDKRHARWCVYRTSYVRSL